MRTPALASLSLVLLACSSPAASDPAATSADSNLNEAGWKVVKTVGARPGQDEVDQEKSAIAVDANGKAHIAFTSHEGLSLSVVGPDGASNDETVDTEGETGRFVAIALDADGREHIAYFENGPTVALKYAERGADGRWTLEKIAGSAENPSIVVDASGTTHVAWFDYGKYQIDYASRPAGGAWSTPEKIADSKGGGCSLAVTKSGEVHVVYLTDLQSSANDGVRGSDGTWSTSPLALGDKLGPVALTSDAAGALHVVAARLDGSRKVSYATKPGGGSWSPAEDADTNQAVGAYYISIAFDEDAQLVRVVASGDDQPILREVTHANGAWTGEWVGHYGQLPSLAVDRSGTSHLTFRDGGGFVYATRPR